MSIFLVKVESFKCALKILSVLCLCVMLVLVAMLMVGVYKSPDYTFMPCLTETCLSDFSNSFKVTLSIFPVVANVLVFCVAIFGVLFAYQQYDLSKLSFKFSNHIVNMGHFNAILKSYLESCSYIRMADVNINSLYSLVYPESKTGNFANFTQYLDKVVLFRKYLIEKSNGSKDKKVPYISSKKSFLNHRGNLKEHLKGFGISLGNISESDLYEVETEVLGFIDSITLNFTDESRVSHLLLKVDRHYAK